MQKIATCGLKIDLHIHSVMSASKDGQKVKNNTLDNISVLIAKLNEQGVNICSITDHDAFSYEMYCALKNAENGIGTIQKVLPGIEFSVRFIADDNNERVVHIVAIFSDKDDKKVSLIEKILQETRPDDGNSYSEENFLKLLRKIDLDTVLIAHQKNTLTSASPRKNDATSLGEDKFLELVSTDFFEAYEFKNKRNEILNKSHLMENNLEDKVRFITGTDCHDWSVYPREDVSDTLSDFPYTYARCLPTFKGLVMAITDWRRLKRVNSFYNADKFNLSQIEFEHNGQVIQIPLSKGINVIIGDNSIGKSLLLHSLTGFEKSGETISKSVKEGYKAYLNKNNIKIKKQIKSENIFAFDMQGEIRNKFEQGRLVSTEFSKYFPIAPNPQPYKAIIHNEIDRLVDYLSKKFELDNEISKLGNFCVHIDDASPESLSFIGKLRGEKTSTNKIEKVLSALQLIKVDLNELLKLQLDEETAIHFTEELKTIDAFISKYETQKQKTTQENDKIECIASVFDSIIKRHNRIISDRQKKQSAFLEHTTTLKDSMVSLIEKNANFTVYKPEINPTDVPVTCNKIQGYSFVTKYPIVQIDNVYFMQHIKSILRVGTKIDFSTITEEKLKSSLLKYDNVSPVLQFFKKSLVESFNSDFEFKSTITLQTAGITEELSAGLNAKIYFDLLSYENSLDGIYIIDQPEDNVSQPSIKAYLLDCFKTMGENRQVIMVSHNPQFIVNLDIDNLIFISRTQDGKLFVQSGALEYESNDYSILKIVEENIDGGLDSIQKRWKRYEKINRI